MEKRQCQTHFIPVVTGLIVVFALAIAAQAGTCTINAGSNQQTIDGFGYSTAWCGQQSDAQFNALMGTGAGQCGFSLLRIRIDPSRAWTDETANAAKAHARGCLVLGTPWSPPASMKTNNNVVHGSLRTDQYGNYANFLRDAGNSINLDYVSVQNEPDWDPDYEGCVWTGDQLKNFCRDNAQNIGRAVIMPEAVNFQDQYSDPTLNDATAASHVTLIAGHIYGGGNYVHQNALNHGKRVWQTEHYIDNVDIGACLNIATTVSDLMNNQFSAYFWWWNNESQACALTSGGTPRKNAYTIGQFAKWVRPGSVRVSATHNPTSGISVTAYKYNNNLIIVAINTNSGSTNQPFTISNSSVGTMQGYRTSSSQNMADVGSFTVSNGSFTPSLPGQSITTFVQTGGGGVSVPTNTWFRLTPRHATSKCLEVANGGTANGSNVQQWGYLGSNAQQWRFEDAGGGYYRITPRNATGRCLDVSGVSQNNGANIHIWDYVGGANQQWQFLDTGGGYYCIIARHSGRCAEVAGGSTADGANVQQWDFLGGANQQWSLTAVGGGGPANGTYRIIARHSGKAMDAYNNGTANGTQIIQWTYGGGANQRWIVTDTGGGQYNIVGVQSGRCVEISNWGTANGTKVQLWDYLGGTNQKYFITPTDGGYFRISPTHAPNSCLDVAGVSTADGANVQLWQWLSGNNQQWAFQAP